MAETNAEKIRNQLSPYWNLVSMLKEYDRYRNEKLWGYIMADANKIKRGQKELLELVDNNTFQESVEEPERGITITNAEKDWHDCSSCFYWAYDHSPICDKCTDKSNYKIP